VFLASLWAVTGTYDLGLWTLMAIGLLAVSLLSLAQRHAIAQP
jgi:hypothetical protein